MKMFKKQEIKMLIITLLFTALIGGCGVADSGEQPAMAKDIAVIGGDEKNAQEQEIEETEDTAADASEEEIAELQYIELTEIEDYYGDKAMYDVYAPKGNSCEDGFLFYSDHGLTFSASAYNYGSNAYLLESLEASVEYATTDWMDEDSEYSDVEISGVLENGNDRYQIVTAKKEDLYGTPYAVKSVYYMDIQEKGTGVLWDLQLFELTADSETNLVIDELAKCYDVDLDKIKTEGEWLAANEERIKEEKAANSLPETILWFNATYAPLTYSNSCDWKVVGGMDATEYNMEFNKSALSRDWSIEDKASALETVERLKEKGHRAKCRECMEELEEMGILDEKDQGKFNQALMHSGIEENLFRYVIAYNMYHDGRDADYIAAWDLCRANQLYADFYICGYMTYEEAMDASLENSIILQQMYSSWEDMVSAYLLGYQFWQSDLALTEYSPTMQRYQCYLDLLEMEDGPYTLDWDMKLQKSW